MKKIIVIGCPGSGKTTFAKKLSERLGISLYHLDSIWHKPDRTHITREEFDLKLDELLVLEEYIIDGNYNRTLERRIMPSDTVILFDLDESVCLSGAVARLSVKRDDIPWMETELDPEFKAQIENFKRNSLPTIYELLEKYKSGRTIVIFKTREEADDFLSKLFDA